jgi:hypothetical protein
MNTGTYASPMPKVVDLGRARETVHGGFRNGTGALGLRDVSFPSREAERLKLQ